ncbi:MAG: sporulation protein YabP [Clostridia bacterium]|nr:sporulation protein YabP [Clostridia bacterium]
MPEGMEAMQHLVTIQDCATLSLTGVKEVDSFDEGVVILRTPCGLLTVEGEGLHIGRLDLEKGECCVDGKITALLWSSVKEKLGLFRRGRDR